MLSFFALCHSFEAICSFPKKAVFDFSRSVGGGQAVPCPYLIRCSAEPKVIGLQGQSFKTRSAMRAAAYVASFRTIKSFLRQSRSPSGCRHRLQNRRPLESRGPKREHHRLPTLANPPAPSG